MLFFFLLLLFAAISGCSTMATNKRPMDEILAEQVKSNKNACIRLQQAEDDAKKAGLTDDQQRYQQARERVCHQYEQKKRELKQYRIDHPHRPNANRF